jgi:hypothetical protein
VRIQAVVQALPPQKEKAPTSGALFKKTASRADAFCRLF